MGDSMREQLTAAFAEADDEQEEIQEEEAGGSIEEPEEPLGVAAEGEEPSELRGEGGDGKEEERKPKEDSRVPVKGAPAGDAGASGGDPTAPVSWKPAMREHWKGLPADVKAEITRRESEIQRGLNDASGYRKVAEEYRRTISPFQSLIQAQGSTPSQAIFNLMSTASQLTQGTPQRKAQVVQNIIKEYGVDITMLDTLLADMPLADDPNGPLLAAMDERLGPINQFMGTMQQKREIADQQVSKEASEELGQFQTSHNEFYEDLREDMADLLEMAANRGRSMTMEEAYIRAGAAHPEIGPILTQRAAAAEGKLSASAAAKKRNAASSIRGSAAVSGGAPGDQREEDNTRALLSDLWDEQSGGIEH